MSETSIEFPPPPTITPHLENVSTDTDMDDFVDAPTHIAPHHDISHTDTDMDDFFDASTGLPNHDIPVIEGSSMHDIADSLMDDDSEPTEPSLAYYSASTDDFDDTASMGDTNDTIDDTVSMGDTNDTFDDTVSMGETKDTMSSDIGHSAFVRESAQADFMGDSEQSHIRDGAVHTDPVHTGNIITDDTVNAGSMGESDSPHEPGDLTDTSGAQATDTNLQGRSPDIRSVPTKGAFAVNSGESFAHDTIDINMRNLTRKQKRELKRALSMSPPPPTNKRRGNISLHCIRIYRKHFGRMQTVNSIKRVESSTQAYSSMGGRSTVATPSDAIHDEYQESVAKRKYLAEKYGIEAVLKAELDEVDKLRGFFRDT